MSTTREEILAALAEHPDGLTTKELAPHCPACECDEQIVGRTIALLRSEDVIHAGSELRNGGAIWLAGPGEKKEVRERPHSLPYRPDAKPVSEAARAIAQMRGGSQSAAERPLARATQPVTRQATVPAAGPQPEVQETAAMTIRERIEAALKAHGPMDSRTMRKRGLKHDALAQSLGDLFARKVLIRLGGGPRSSVYGLPGQKLEDASTAPRERAEVKLPATKSTKTPKVKKAKKAKKTTPKGHGQQAGRRKLSRNGEAPGAHRTSPAPHTNGEAAFAINELGELGIEVEGQKLRLDSKAFERLRGFIDRTKPVWSE